MRKSIFLVSLFCLLACKKENTRIQQGKSIHKKIVSQSNPKKLSYNETVENLKASIPENSYLSNDIQFINDSILKGKFKLDISQYEIENEKKWCLPNILKKQDFYEYNINDEQYTSKEFKNLGDLNGDGKTESIFILPGLNICEEDQSYYFTDNSIPRIESDSGCCHLESVFSIGDIDEDGGNEIAEYNSSCASNFKAFRIWTLKKGKWKFIDNITFYYNNGKYEAFKDFNKLYKKIAKNKFKFLEISDMRANGQLVMEWKTITMK